MAPLTLMTTPLGADETLDDLVGEWLTVPDLAQRWHLSITAVRRLLDDGELIAIRRGERAVLSVPAAFAAEEGPVAALRGTCTVLGDGGFTDEDIVRWLFTPQESLPGGPTPMSALLAGFKTEVRRRAMEEA